MLLKYLTFRSRPQTDHRDTHVGDLAATKQLHFPFVSLNTTIVSLMGPPVSSQ